MAHSCPECGMTCYCNGDIDDILLDEDDAINRCDHCSPFDDDDWDDDELGFEFDED